MIQTNKQTNTCEPFTLPEILQELSLLAGWLVVPYLGIITVKLLATLVVVVVVLVVDNHFD
jgi:hypothetical protein